MKGISETEIEPVFTSLTYKEASLGTLAAIGSGWGIFAIIFLLDSAFNWGLINYFSKLFIIGMPSQNFYYIVTVIFSFVIQIPHSFGWFVGGIILGFYYKRNKTYYNEVKGSWKSFQIAIIAIILTFIVGSIYIFISYIFGGSLFTPFLFYGGLNLYIITFFVTPGFWFSFSFVLLGGIIGGRLIKPKFETSEPSHGIKKNQDLKKI